jgi:hypothetical protein
MKKKIFAIIVALLLSFMVSCNSLSTGSAEPVSYKHIDSILLLTYADSTPEGINDKSATTQKQRNLLYKKLETTERAIIKQQKRIDELIAKREAIN